MNFRLFSIFDTRARVYLAPFVARSTVDATRQIAASASDPAFQQTPVGLHPQDFDLVNVGSFDDETGVIVSEVEFVSKISDLVTSTVSS